MKDFWTKAVLGAAALLCVGAANATLIDFENVDTSTAPLAGLGILTDQDYVTQGGYAFGAYNPNNGGLPDGSLVGALLNGSDPSQCLDGACPTGDSTNYAASLDDGFLFIAGNGKQFGVGSFDAAFLQPDGVTLPSGLVAFLAIEGDRADGSYIVDLFPLLGPNKTTGLTAFSSFNTANGIFNGGTGSLSDNNFVSAFAYAFYCDPAGTSCSLASSNKGQFAIDNIGINAAVPEPSDWLLMTFGLGALGALVRRRRSL